MNDDKNIELFFCAVWWIIKVFFFTPDSIVWDMVCQEKEKKMKEKAVFKPIQRFLWCGQYRPTTHNKNTLKIALN